MPLNRTSKLKPQTASFSDSLSSPPIQIKLNSSRLLLANSSHFHHYALTSWRKRPVQTLESALHNMVDGHKPECFQLQSDCLELLVIPARFVVFCPAPTQLK